MPEEQFGAVYGFGDGIVLTLINYAKEDLERRPDRA